MKTVPPICARQCAQVTVLHDRVGPALHIRASAISSLCSAVAEQRWSFSRSTSPMMLGLHEPLDSRRERGGVAALCLRQVAAWHLSRPPQRGKNCVSPRKSSQPRRFVCSSITMANGLSRFATREDQMEVQATGCVEPIVGSVVSLAATFSPPRFCC